MRASVTAWARARWPDVRILHELALGRRRVDLVFVRANDIAVAEIKSSVDRLDRLEGQVREYQFYVPEVWIALAPKWIDHRRDRFHGVNRLRVTATDCEWLRPPRSGKPHRDELTCSRLLELLWYSEALRIAQRTDVLPGPAHKQLRKPHVKKLLARLLTGNEIIKEVCTELRARAGVGMRSDAPTR